MGPLMPQEKVFEDVEIHDVNDMNERRYHKVKDAVEKQEGSPVIWKALSVIIAMLAIVYDLAPVDAVPDVVPLFGWLDDVGFTIMAALNAYQHFSKDQKATFVRIAKYVKWMMIALVVIAAASVGGLFYALVNLIMH